MTLFLLTPGVRPSFMAVSASRNVVMLSLPLWQSKKRKPKGDNAGNIEAETERSSDREQEGGRERKKERKKKRERERERENILAYIFPVEGLKHGQHAIKLGHHVVCDLLASVHSVRLCIRFAVRKKTTTVPREESGYNFEESNTKRKEKQF